MNTEEKFNHSIYEWSGIGYLEENYGKCEDTILLFCEYEEYKEYVDSLINNISNQDLYEELLGYTHSSFENEMLVFIIHWEHTGSTKIALQDVVYDSTKVKITLKRNYPDSGYDEMMKDYGIIIRLPKNESITSAEYSVIDN